VNGTFRCASCLYEVNLCEVLSIFAQLGGIFMISCIISADAFKQFVSKLSIHLTEHFHCPSLQTVKHKRRVNYVTEHNYDIRFYDLFIYLFISRFCDFMASQKKIVWKGLSGLFKIIERHSPGMTVENKEKSS
jgi:hypothetical protein